MIKLEKGRCLTGPSFNFKEEEWHERTRKIYLKLYNSSATDLSSFLAYICDKKLEDFNGYCSRGIMLVRIRLKILTTPSV